MSPYCQYVTCAGDLDCPCPASRWVDPMKTVPNYQDCIGNYMGCREALVLGNPVLCGTESLCREHCSMDRCVPTGQTSTIHVQSILPYGWPCDAIVKDEQPPDDVL